MTEQRHIVMEPEDLLARRPRIVEKLLRPLAANGRIKCGFTPGVWHGARALGAYQGTMPRIDPADWLFASRVASIQCNYHEHWRTDDDGQSFYLFKAYLALYRVTSRRELLDIVALHCDPNDSDNEPMRSWKRGPHLHIDDGAGFPMKKCHFPLELGNLDRALADADSLFLAYSRAVRVINSDLLSRYREAGI